MNFRAGSPRTGALNSLSQFGARHFIAQPSWPAPTCTAQSPPTSFGAGPGLRLRHDRKPQACEQNRARLDLGSNALSKNSHSRVYSLTSIAANSRYERARLGFAWTHPCPRSSQKSRTRTLELRRA